MGLTSTGDLATSGQEAGRGWISWDKVSALPKEGPAPAPVRVSVRELARHASKVLGHSQEKSCPTVVTFRGTPAWVILPLDQQRLASLLLSSVDELRDGILKEDDFMDKADAYLAEGNVKTVDAILDEHGLR